jgi:hypothetical protein
VIPGEGRSAGPTPRRYERPPTDYTSGRSARWLDIVMHGEHRWEVLAVGGGVISIRRLDTGDELYTCWVRPEEVVFVRSRPALAWWLWVAGWLGRRCCPVDRSLLGLVSGWWLLGAVLALAVWAAYLRVTGR